MFQMILKWHKTKVSDREIIYCSYYILLIKSDINPILKKVLNKYVSCY